MDDDLNQKIINLQNQINEINGNRDSIRMNTSADVYKPSQSSHDARINILESEINQINFHNN